MTDKFQLDIIELGKMGKGKRLTKEEKELMYWCKFIKTPEEVDSSIMEKYKEIKEAKEQLDEINADEHERYMAIMRERALHDEVSLRHDGYTEGYEEGKIEVAKKLIKKGLDIKFISEVTGLSNEEIEKIK